MHTRIKFILLLSFITQSLFSQQKDNVLWYNKPAKDWNEALPTDSLLNISNATDVILMISAATSYNGYDKCPDKDGKDEKAEVQRYITAALSKSYNQIKANHIQDYAHFFNRVTLSITSQQTPGLPTDERLKLYKTGTPDPKLEEL